MRQEGRRHGSGIDTEDEETSERRRAGGKKPQRLHGDEENRMQIRGGGTDPGKRSGYRADHRREACRKAGIGKEEGASGRERFPSFIRRPFSPKREAANRRDRPTWAFFRRRPPLARSCLNHRRRSVLYTCIQLVLASPGRPASRGIDSSERNIIVVEILSRGSNRASPERAEFVLFRRMGLVM